MTNRELITAALRMLGVLDADSPTAPPEDAALGLTELNDTMTDLLADGIDLGYPPQESVNDEFPLNEADTASIKPIFALRLRVYYPNAQPTIDLPARAQTCMQRLLRDAVLSNMQEASMTNIPLGSAGRCGYDILNGE